jgi:hypothetical protein
MILRTFSLTLEPINPVRFSLDTFRASLLRDLAGYLLLHQENAAGFIHRYPVVQCRQIKNTLTVVGINEGAEFLKFQSDHGEETGTAENTCRICGKSPGLVNEEFGVTATLQSYEFVTSWLPFSQENNRKFYLLKIKEEREAFIRTMLIGNILTLSKSLGYTVPGPLTADINMHFQKEWIDGAGIITLSGKFTMPFLIPDYLGIGRSVSTGFGAIRKRVPKML